MPGAASAIVPQRRRECTWRRRWDARQRTPTLATAGHRGVERMPGMQGDQKGMCESHLKRAPQPQVVSLASVEARRTTRAGALPPPEAWEKIHRRMTLSLSASVAHTTKLSTGYECCTWASARAIGGES